MRVNAFNQTPQNQSFGAFKLVGRMTKECRGIVDTKIKTQIPQNIVDLWDKNGYDVVLKKLDNKKGANKYAGYFDLRVVKKSFKDASVSAAWVEILSKTKIDQTTENLGKALRKEFVKWAKFAW